MSEPKKSEIYDGQYVIPEKSRWEKVKERFHRTPKIRRVKSRYGKVYAIIGAVLFAVATGLCSYFGVFSSADYMLSDRIFRLINEKDKEDSVIKIIGIDEVTEKEYGEYKDWSRTQTANLIKRLDSAEFRKPLAIGLALDYTEEKDDGGDDDLVTVCKRYDNICLAITRSRRGDGAAGETQDALGMEPPKEAREGSGEVAPENAAEDSGEMGLPENAAEDGGEMGLPENAKAGAAAESALPEEDSDTSVTGMRRTLELPFEALRPYVSVGIMNMFNTMAGVARESMINTQVEGKQYDSFSIAVYKEYLESKGETYSAPASNRNNNFTFNYSRESGEYDVYSFYDVMEGNVNPKVFKDSIVLVADYTDQKVRTSSRRNTMQPVEVQANVIDALVEQKTGQSVSKIFMAVLYAVFIALFFFITAYRSGSHLILETLFLIIALVLTCAVLDLVGFYLLILIPLVFLVVIMILNLITRYVALWKSRHHLEDILTKYVDKNIVNEIVSEGEIAVRIGGIKKDIAVLFVDIRGFTSLSESMDPEQIVDILNRYLSLVSKAISVNQGTLDKFIGDAAMALFNSPFDLKNYEYHAACAAWDIKESAAELNEMCEKEYGKKVNFGIGIHCGEAVIGNIGSELRMDYTAIGDTVNTASRLESSAEAGQILISEEMKERLGDKVVTSFVGDYSFKGKKNTMPVYQIDEIAGREEPEVIPEPAERIII